MGIGIKTEINIGTTYSFIIDNKLTIEERKNIVRPFTSVYNGSTLRKPNKWNSINQKDCCPKILIVDNNEHNIYALRMLL